MADSTYGQSGAVDYNSPFNSTAFQIREALGNVRTTVPVKIIAVNGGGVGAAPTVDVQPLVNQMDGIGDKTDHGIIYGIPVQRSQGGSAAIINDPKVGDVGFMSVADRDISALKGNEGSQSNPGSFRRHSMSDGVYVGAMLNPATPTRYINMNGPGITIGDEFGNMIVSSAAGVTINGVLIDRNGNITTPGGVTAGEGTADSVTLQHHIHGGGPPPTPGT